MVYLAIVMEALVEMDVGIDGGAGDPRLRRWWRGRGGLSKAEQVVLYESEWAVEEEEGEDSEGEGDEEEGYSSEGEEGAGAPRPRLQP